MVQGVNVGVLEWGYPDFPTCGPPRGSIDSLVWPSFNMNNTRPSRGAKPREAGNAKTPKGIDLLRLAPEGRGVLCKATSRGSAGVSHDDQGQAGARWAQSAGFLFGSREESPRSGVLRNQPKVPITMQRDQDRQDGRTEVIDEPITASRPEAFRRQRLLLSG